MIRLGCLLVFFFHLPIVLSECEFDCGPHGVCNNDLSSCDCDIFYEGLDCSIYRELLAIGESVANSVRRTEWKYFEVSVSKSGTTLNWWLNQSISDFGTKGCDLYIQKGTFPDHYSYLARNISLTQNLQIVLNDQHSENYFAGVYGYHGCTFLLSIDLAGACPDECSRNGECVQGSCRCFAGYSGSTCEVPMMNIVPDQVYEGSIERHRWVYFYFIVREVYEGLDWVFEVVQHGFDDCNIYLKTDYPPSFLDFDSFNNTVAPVKTLNMTEIIKGKTYYLGVEGYTGCSYHLHLETVFPSTPTDCPNNCSDHGESCAQNRCHCKKSYTGLACEEYTRDLELDTVMTGYVGSNSWNYYHFFGHSASPRLIVVNRTSQSGDCDLFVNAQKKPTNLNFLFLEESPSGHLAVVIPYPLAQEWYIGIFGWESCSYSLSVSETDHCDCALPPHGAGDCLPGSSICICDAGWAGVDCSKRVTNLFSAVPKKDLFIRNNEWAYYVLRVNGSSAFSLTLQESETTGSIWVFIQRSEYPTIAEYDYSDKNILESRHQISYSTQQSFTGDVFIGVFGSPFIPEFGINGPPTVSYDLLAWVSDF